MAYKKKIGKREQKKLDELNKINNIILELTPKSFEGTFFHSEKDGPNLEFVIETIAKNPGKDKPRIWMSEPHNKTFECLKYLTIGLLYKQTQIYASSACCFTPKYYNNELTHIIDQKYTAYFKKFIKKITRRFKMRYKKGNITLYSEDNLNYLESKLFLIDSEFCQILEKTALEPGYLSAVVDRLMPLDRLMPEDRTTPQTEDVPLLLTEDIKILILDVFLKNVKKWKFKKNI